MACVARSNCSALPTAPENITGFQDMQRPQSDDWGLCLILLCPDYDAGCVLAGEPDCEAGA